jgi:2'-5' RNA ligase
MRLFLGFAPENAERAVYNLCDQLALPDELPLRWVPPENWHITVVFLGDLPERDLGRVVDTVAPIVQDCAPMEVTLEELAWFPSAMKPRLLTLGVETAPALMSLQADVAAALRRAGFHSEQRAYRPHLTLARLKGSRKLVTPPALLPITPVSARLDELVLFESQVRERRYIPLQRIGLAA